MLFRSVIPKGATLPSLSDWRGSIKQRFGGYDATIDSITQTIHASLMSPSGRRALPQRCFLLDGIHGSGKTRLAHLIAEHSGLPVWTIDGSQCMNRSGIEEQTTAAFRELLGAAVRNAPSILVIDQLDSLCPPLASVESQSSIGSIEAHLSCLLKSFIDYIHFQSLAKDSQSLPPKIFVIATCTTSTEGVLDDSMLRSGRFDRVFTLNVPSPKQRNEILDVLLHRIPLDAASSRKDVCLHLSRLTHGFVAADLESLCHTAVLSMVEGNGDSLPACRMSDFELALKHIRPANLAEHMKRSTLSQTVSFDDFGGVQDIVQQLKVSVVGGVNHLESYRRLGVTPPSGILFFGPSGTGKTQMAQALANEAGLNLISVQGPELVSPIVGQSEKNIVEIYTRARASAPCILFLDQIDAIAGTRSDSGSSSRVQERTLSCLLTEMDGVTEHRSIDSFRKSIIFLGVTERRESLDPAILRPGRLDLHVLFNLPDFVGRAEILRKCLQSTPLDREVSLELLAEETEGFSGAELKNICQEAVMICLREDLNHATVSAVHFEKALELCKSRPKTVQDHPTEHFVPKRAPISFSFDTNTLHVDNRSTAKAPVDSRKLTFDFKW